LSQPKPLAFLFSMKIFLANESLSALKRQLELEEGKRQFPYLDSRGILTGGIGRNLQEKGFSEEEMYFMLDNDIHDAYEPLSRNLSYFECLDDVRKIVLIDMAFNLGAPRLFQFKKMLDALKTGDYKTAAHEMRNSQWAYQVPNRAQRLALMMETGKFNVA
jgi:lysozyme